MRQFIKKRLNETLTLLSEDLKFNDNGKFNKSGANTIFYNGEPIVDFGVGEIGTVTIGKHTIPNAIYLKGGYNASKQRMGYGTLGVKFIFQKLPKIENLVLDCYDTACPFWIKLGAKTIQSRDIANSGRPLHTVVINRNDFIDGYL
jgi:hypothetical protein